MVCVTFGPPARSFIYRSRIRDSPLLDKPAVLPRPIMCFGACPRSALCRLHEHFSQTIILGQHGIPDSKRLYGNGLADHFGPWQSLADL